jgi:peptide/nickel transport system substrate-binding protein
LRRLVAWKGIYQALSTRDRIIFLVLSVIATGAFLFWLCAGYLALTQSAPDFGGQYIEGVAAQPRYINPILSQTSDADADLAELLYTGLFRDGDTGSVEKHIASDYQVSEDGRTYTVFLRPGVRFHDGEELTADDVVFTVRSIQDPAYKSPLRANWQGVEAAATDPYTVVFTLKKPYFGFLENLTVGILPKHIWEDIAPDNFTLADYNLSQPIGSGPYQFDEIDKDSQGNILSIRLRSNAEYFAGVPYIDRVTFRFYPDEDSLIAAYDRQEVMGMHSVSYERAQAVLAKKATRLYEFPLPRLFAVFLNTNKSEALAYDEVREALALATDRQHIMEDALQGHGTVTSGPFSPFVQGYGAAEIPFDVVRANTLLDEHGWKLEEDGIRTKNGISLTFELAVPDWTELMRTADMLSEGWLAIGVRAEVKVLSQADLQQDIIRPREYQALLFGQGSMLDPDPYSFWHSSQKNDPGLNLAFYENKEVDGLLTDAREMLDPARRRETFQRFQAIIASEHPAVFLYSPNYLYVVSDAVQGIEVHPINFSSSRLSDITTWYIETKRVKK